MASNLSLQPISRHTLSLSWRNWSVIFLPLFHALDRQDVIRILCRLLVHIDNDQHQDHFLDSDLIHSAQTFDEMRRRIDMCSLLSDVGEHLGEKSAAHRVRSFVVPINRLARFIRKSRPARNARLKRAREIDILFPSQNLLTLCERRIVSVLC